jgi:anti-sigma factor RsiW
MEICEAMAIELPGYVEGKLDPGTTAMVEKHVRVCAACTAEVRELDRLNVLLAEGLPPITPSPDFAASFAKRLAAEIAAEERESMPSERRWLGWLLQPSWIPLAAAAALGVIMFAPWFNGSQSQSPSVSVAPPLTGSVASTTNPLPGTGVAELSAKASNQVASTKAEGGERLATASVPADLLGRADLFVDFDVIRDLDLLESTGSRKATRRGEAG